FGGLGQFQSSQNIALEVRPTILKPAVMIFRVTGTAVATDNASSKPPSSDGLSGSPRQRGRRKKSKRKPGGQLGHEGRNRPLVPGDRVDRVVKLYPEQCCGCGRNLAKTGRGMEMDGEPRRHQVTEIPEIQAHITEYQCYKVVCPDCEKVTAAALPE